LYDHYFPARPIASVFPPEGNSVITLKTFTPPRAALRHGDERDAVECGGGVGENGVGERIVIAIFVRVAAIERGPAFAGAQAAAPFNCARDVRERRGR
jgi:hypothetical protein